MSGRLIDCGVELTPDPGRVVAQLFLPGESTPGSSSRTQAVLERVLALADDELAVVAEGVLGSFGDRHVNLTDLLRRNALIVKPELGARMAPDAAVAIGALFTAETAIEGAAVTNPSVVAHPDQSGVPEGALRVVVSLRSIGEGHLSSIGFCEALIGADRSWTFDERELPVVMPRIANGEWDRDHLIRALENDGRTSELGRTVVQGLPERFASGAVERAVRMLPAPFLHQPDARSQQETIRVVATSAYRATFAEASVLSQRVLMPVADEESRGVEDLRLVRFTDDDGSADYRGTYTAYNGHTIASRLLTTKDFRNFTIDRLTGSAAATKGMALFPRRIGGTLFALARGDGESLSLTASRDGLDWAGEQIVHRPSHSWELVQSGNCGSPIETEVGWLVLTHGVGPLRTYAIGAVLLDLDDPSKLIGEVERPILQPDEAASGYVPNVVYSCGGIVHDGVLWLPYGVADQRVRVARVEMADLLAEMRPPS